MHPAKCQKSEINPNNKPSVSKSAITTALTTIPSSMASTHKKADALFLSYSAGLEDDAAAAEVMEYLDKGGVVVLLSSQVLKQPTFNGAKTVVTVGTGNLALMKMLFGEQVTLIEGVYEGIHTWKLPKGNKDDVILDGPFGDIRGQYLTTGMALPIEGGSFTTPFTNGCISVSYDNISASKLDWVITATNYNNATAAEDNRIVGFKAKDYNFIWISDPSLFSYSATISNNIYTLNVYSNTNLESGTFRPISLPNKRAANQSNYEVDGTKISTVNSIFLANILNWAMEQAELEGYNSNN